MPLYLWLLLGGVTAYLVAKGGATAAASAPATVPIDTINLDVQGPPSAPGPFSIPVESSLPMSFQQLITTLFVQADQQGFDPNTVSALSMQLAGLGYSIAAGSVQSAWQMIVTAMATASASDGGAQSDLGSDAPASSSACLPGTRQPTPHEIMMSLAKPGECVKEDSSSSADVSLEPTVFHPVSEGSPITQNYIRVK